ncbi:S1C family serine protease [Lutimonas sp.]|uniref:S1C family serine protease n=1 Tax=Lutimonas sp. TaxID=1872403 RepID=UPI003D9B5D12
MNDTMNGVKKILLTALLMLSFSINAQTLSELYQKVNPAVVVILTEQKELVSSGKTTQTVTAGGLGSGFMISDTQIITAAHVVQVAEKVNVQFLDGETIPAKVISAYATADVALLELIWPKKNAVSLKLADSNLAKIGEKVFVVGAPYGLGHSLSSGYISGIIKDKHSKNPFTNSEYIQTDAAINTGNSGGPMINMKGEVIGVVSNILTQSGGFQGIGFASSSNITKELLFEKKILWNGTDLIPLTGKMAQIFNLPQESGLLVQRVVKLSPFGVLGVEDGDIEMTVNGEKLIAGGDIILSINGVKFESTDESLLNIAKVMEIKGENQPLEIVVFRAGKKVTLGRK